MENMREYISKKVSIDGRTIPYTVATVSEYLAEHDHMTQEEIDRFCDHNYEVYQKINQILAIKQSCFLLRHTSYSCQSLSDDLYQLKLQMIRELEEKYGYKFDDAWMETLVPEDYDSCNFHRMGCGIPSIMIPQKSVAAKEEQDWQKKLRQQMYGV